MTKWIKITYKASTKSSQLGNLKFHCKFKDCLRFIATVALKLKQGNTFFLRCQLLTSERHNLHHYLCVIDPQVISFDGESQLNVLLYGSDEFNGKINK